MKNLSGIGPRIEKQAVRSGLTAAAAVVRAEARERAPKESGAMARAIKSGSARKNKDGTYSIRVYVDERMPNGFLGYFHEYGTEPHFIARTDPGNGRVAIKKAAAGAKVEGVGKKPMKLGGDFVGGIIEHPGYAARPFLRPALDNKTDELIAAFRVKIRDVVEKKTGFDIEAGQDDAEAA